MECAKCQGLMVQERVTDGLASLTEWRCLNCGSILDPVIMKHKTENRRRRHTVPAFETVPPRSFPLQDEDIFLATFEDELPLVS
jgi:hypothetical protein